MQYFEEYPKIVYDLVGKGDYKVVTDLLRRVKVRDGVKNNVSLFDKYNVKDGETPEQVSQKFYFPLLTYNFGKRRLSRLSSSS